MTNAPRSIIVIGRKGQLARELADLSWPTDIRPRFLGRGEINLFDTGHLAARLESFSPLAIINTAAHTAVDLAESEPVLAQQLNADVPASLAVTARQLGIPFLHVSTDYVFSGGSSIPYRESDTTAPLSIYGHSKRAGEIAVIETGANALILRSAGLFGRHGQNFVKTMVTKAGGNSAQTITVVDDQISCPTPAAALAAGLQQMACDMIAGRPLPALLHFAGQRPVSWFDFTSAIFKALAESGCTQLPALVPVKSSDFPRPALRPAFSALDCSLAASLGYRVPDWQAPLPALVAGLTKERIAA